MAAMNPIVKPLNRVVVAGNPLYYPYKVKTATNVQPKRLVTKDTTDAQIKVCGATDPVLGVAGFEQAPSSYKPATINTAYNADDECPVILGGSGAIVVVTLTTSQTVVLGDELEVIAGGLVQKYGTGTKVGKAMESVTTTGATADIMMRLY